MRLVLATGNPGKLAELRRLLAAYPLVLVDTATVGVKLPAESGATYVANARIKARAAAEATGCMALGDDTGLEVDQLGGRPGLHTARYAEAAGGWSEARARLAHDVGLVSAPEKTVTATLRCALAIALPDGTMHTSEGSFAVRLVWPPRGEGPGFVPMLEPAAEAPLLSDGVLAHRRAAFEQLKGRASELLRAR